MILDEYDKRFLERLYKRRSITPTGCWEWTGFINKKGYGRTNYYGKSWLVSRIISYLLKHEGWDKDLYVLHKCNNRKCFNPEHLYYGDNADNQFDALKAGTFYNVSKDYCMRGHELSGDNVSFYKNKRCCLACRKIRHSRRIR